jgi:hypothetical protein
LDFSRRQAARAAVSVIALAAISLATPRALPGQQPAPTAVGGDQLTVFATAYAQIAVVRDSVQAQLANARNKTPEAQAQLREGLKQRIVQIIGEHGMTEDEYRRITYVISTDAEQREAFEKILAELTAKDPETSGGP